MQMGNNLGLTCGLAADHRVCAGEQVSVLFGACKHTRLYFLIVLLVGAYSP